MLEILFLIAVLSSFEPPQITRAGFECLQENVYFESGNQRFDGKLAVASVTILRKQSDSFPDRLCDVVKQQYRGICQFSWVCAGRKLNLDNRAERLAYFQSGLAAAIVLLKGPTINAKFFHTNSVNPSWSRNATPIAMIDDHVFFNTL